MSLSSGSSAAIIEVVFEANSVKVLIDLTADVVFFVWVVMDFKE